MSVCKNSNIPKYTYKVEVNIMKAIVGLDLKLTDWKAIRSRVKAVNTEFAELVDQVNPDSSYRLYVAKYPFGAQILENGKFFLQGENGKPIPFLSESIPVQIREDLDYNLATNPIAMVLQNNLEMFVALEDRIVPVSIISPGKMFGLWRCMDKVGLPENQENFSHTSMFIWGMTAGARSIFMLPKISEALAHNKLKLATQITADKPNSLSDHWKIFRDIAQQKDFSDKWEVEILFFSKKWADALNDPAWLPVRDYLFNMVWKNTGFGRNQYVWNLTFTRIQALRKIKASPNIADTVKHLLAMGTGAYPGFRPALNDDLLPLQGLQQAYMDYYEVEYAPLIMQPSTFDFRSQQDPAYYSLQFPTACELAPKVSSRSSAISDLYDIRGLVNKYLSYITDKELNVEATPLYDLAKKLSLNYYHNNVELYEGMFESSVLPEVDPNFKKAMQPFANKEFPKNSPFFKGVISISCKK